MQAARLDAALAKLFRYNDGVRTLGAELNARHERGELVARKATDGMIDYSRARFNRMSGSEQAAYMRRLESRRYYWIECRDGTGTQIPKLAFDAMALPLAAGSLA